jgi:hypothetical protein
MWDFEIGHALALMGRTLPFILLRIAVYAGIAIAYVVATGLGAGLGWAIGGVGGPEVRASGAFWGGAIGFGVVAAVLYWLRAYILYVVKAAHIAVLVDLIDGKPLPQGRSQIEQGRQVVTARFAEVNVLFAVDQLVKGVLAALTGLVSGIATVLPLPGIPALVNLLRAFLRIAVGFVDEVILGYMIRSQAVNPWRSAETALILYAQNYKIMLKNAAWLAFVVYLLGLVVFIVMLTPAAAIAFLFPGGWAAIGVVFALLFTWSLKAALLEPFAIACLMQVYFRAIEGQSPDPEWEERLAQLSRKFARLKDRAAVWVSQPAAGPGRAAS